MLLTPPDVGGGALAVVWKQVIPPLLTWHTAVPLPLCSDPIPRIKTFSQLLPPGEKSSLGSQKGQGPG